MIMIPETVRPFGTRSLLGVSGILEKLGRNFADVHAGDAAAQSNTRYTDSIRGDSRR